MGGSNRRHTGIESRQHGLHLLGRSQFIEQNDVRSQAAHRLLNTGAFGAVQQHIALGQAPLSREFSPLVHHHRPVTPSHPAAGQLSGQIPQQTGFAAGGLPRT